MNNPLSSALIAFLASQYSLPTHTYHATDSALPLCSMNGRCFVCEGDKRVGSSRSFSACNEQVVLRPKYGHNTFLSAHTSCGIRLALQASHGKRHPHLALPSRKPVPGRSASAYLPSALLFPLAGHHLNALACSSLRCHDCASRCELGAAPCKRTRCTTARLRGGSRTFFECCHLDTVDYECAGGVDEAGH